MEEKEEEEGEEVKSIIIDVDQLFQLSEIAFLVELAFATAEKSVYIPNTLLEDLKPNSFTLKRYCFLFFCIVGMN